MLSFVPVFRGCVWYVCCYVRKKGSSPVPAITERRDMDLYGFPGLCPCWIWNRDYACQLPYVRYYVVVKSSFKHARDECEPKRTYVF